MKLLDILVTQRSLRDVNQIPDMLENLESLPRILIGDGCCLDGHHRLMAYWLAGRVSLRPWEYVQTDCWRQTFGNVQDLQERVQIRLCATFLKNRSQMSRKTLRALESKFGTQTEIYTPPLDGPLHRVS